MLSRLNITAKGLTLVLLPVVFQIIFALILTSMLISSVDALEYLQHSLSAISNISKRYNRSMALACTVMDRDERDIGKKLRALDDAAKLIEWVDQASVSKKRFPELTQIETDAAEFHAALMQTLAKFKKAISAPGYNIYNNDAIVTVPEALPMFLEAQSINDRLFGIERQMVSSQPQELEKARQSFFGWLVAALFGSCLISIWLGQAFTRDFVERLGAVSKQAAKILVGETTSKPQAGSDEISQLEAILYDTSVTLRETRRSELAILENVTHIFCALDRSLKFQRVVLDSRRTWGFDVDELRGRSLLSLLAEEAKQKTNLAFETIANQGGTAQFENTVRCKDGVFKTFAWTVNWRPAENLFFCVVRDVTELRALEKLKANFLGMVTSDLRGPLAAVAKSLENLHEERSGKLSASAKSRVELARRNNKRLTDLIGELFDVEKLNQSKANLQVERVKVSKLCLDAKEQLRELADKSSIEIIEPKADSEVSVDAGRITQVIVNLLSNAIKFSPAYSRIEFDLKMVGDFAEVGVKDSGPGIPIEQQGLIFSRFHQIKGGSSKGIKGSGLGLAIVQSMVADHGGTVGVESAVGEGSRFWIRIPAARIKEVDS